MAAEQAVTASAWAEAEKLYPDRSTKISEIAALVGLTPIQLSQEAKRRGWKMRTPPRTARVAPSQAERVKDGPTKGSAAIIANRRRPTKAASARANPVLLVQRVYETIASELEKLEQQHGVSSQDRERASRALSQITNSLEKAVEMQRDIKKAMTKTSGKDDREALAHAEDLRRAIAERLERLQRQRALGKRSGGTE